MRFNLFAAATSSEVYPLGPFQVFIKTWLYDFSEIRVERKL
jgi:hypothetical protein